MLDIKSSKYGATLVTKPTEGQVAKIEMSLHLSEKISSASSHLIGYINTVVKLLAQRQVMEEIVYGRKKIFMKAQVDLIA